MLWVPVAAWVAAVVIAAVVLGFTGYEIWWKATRLQRDVELLLSLRENLIGIQNELVAAQERLAQAGSR